MNTLSILKSMAKMKFMKIQIEDRQESKKTIGHIGRLEFAGDRWIG